jgi:hypothetical protein
MSGFLGFVVGFVAGWATRSTVESSREAAVGLASAATDLLERVKRAAAIEGDYLEDFVAEVRSRMQARRRWPESAANGHGAEGLGNDAAADTNGRGP